MIEVNIRARDIEHLLKAFREFVSTPANPRELVQCLAYEGLEVNVIEPCGIHADQSHPYLLGKKHSPNSK